MQKFSVSDGHGTIEFNSLSALVIDLHHTATNDYLEQVTEWAADKDRTEDLDVPNSTLVSTFDRWSKIR